ncbi:GDNF-inducible zinc finger protein 1-like [Gigantopelta aegis]|uniref:GDNF-inducible zinc finger protein 1-like n=1 Tax=Gigantopelta aegis TaxID=1735272 RepID=UPI001B888CB5|nr:GDNF-inducible zinc finger protein 1-like [Gigantopelta aegis]XP_041348712.1 GDNF-inducible zinc finger protein 1-like [Gigantopelta aegis]XP_041348713.1 GDNF-inducible zinc finger protein 1-like [Gigantopelta aegis]XP_041348714.1 GDNF-inducible zinc finger protein 1-like [Gigantopelta aegis]
MDAFLPSVLDSTADILENSNLALNSFSSDLDSTELPITSNVDLYLECEEDGGSVSMQPCSDFYLSHEFIGENIQLAISFPNPSNDSVSVDDSFSCTLCNGTFRKQTSLFKHLQAAHSVRQSYTCDVCTFATTSSKLLSRHKMGKHSHSKIKKSTAVLVDTPDSTVKVTLLSDKRFANTSAGKDAVGPDIIVDRIMEDDMIVAKNVCDERDIFSVKSALVQSNTSVHNRMTNHMDTAIMSESDTNIKSNSNGVMVSGYADSEVKTLLLDTSFQCNICTYTSNSKRLLKYHTDTMHNPQRELFKCVLCSYTCRQKRTLDLHIAKQHTGGETWTCYHCQKKFFSTSALKRHLSIHTEEKPFVCSLNSCFKAFKTAGALGDHKRKVHSEPVRRNLNGGGRRSWQPEGKRQSSMCISWVR